MSDLISRQAAIKAIEDLQDCHNGFSDTYDKACIIGVIEEVPPIDLAIEVLKAESFYDGYAYCVADFGWDTVLCKDCKYYKQSAVADRKMCFRKDVDGVEVCYDFLPHDSCTYGERKEVEE